MFILFCTSRCALVHPICGISLVVLLVQLLCSSLIFPHLLLWCIGGSAPGLNSQF